MKAGTSPLITPVAPPPAVRDRARARRPARDHGLRARRSTGSTPRSPPAHRGYVCVAAVHTVMACQEDPALRAAVLGADFTVPDGQPLVWALRALGHPLEDRVYGPELMDRACARAARTGQRFFLYGGRNQGALVELTRMLRLRHPGLKIVGGYAPPFRELTDAEDEAVALEIHRSGADVVWVGIGVPKQEKWMARMRDRLDAPVLIGVGAAFDFHAGIIPQAPADDAALRARVAVPPAPGAAPPVAALPALQPAVRARLRAPVLRAHAAPDMSGATFDGEDAEDRRRSCCSCRRRSGLPAAATGARRRLRRQPGDRLARARRAVRLRPRRRRRDPRAPLRRPGGWSDWTSLGGVTTSGPAARGLRRTRSSSSSAAPTAAIYQNTLDGKGSGAAGSARRIRDVRARA